ncbi:hypothetical protein ACFLZK_00015 [Patescibacteria group bacterium]
MKKIVVTYFDPAGSKMVAEVSFEEFDDKFTKFFRLDPGGLVLVNRSSSESFRVDILARVFRESDADDPSKLNALPTATVLEWLDE